MPTATAPATAFAADGPTTQSSFWAHGAAVRVLDQHVESVPASALEALLEEFGR